MTKEKNTDPTTIALMGNDIGYIKSDISDIKKSIKELTGVFASKEELAQVARQTETRLISLEEKKDLWKVLTPLVSGVFASVLTFLTISFLQSK